MASSIDIAPPISTPPARHPAAGPVGPSGADVVPVAYDAIYTWDYAVQRQDLRNLYEKSKQAAWDARTALPWDTDVDPERESVPDQFCPIWGSALWDRLDKKTEVPKLRRLSSSYMLSNFLHGEQGALFAAAQLVSSVPGVDAKFYAATQVADEARHVEAYERYLREKIEMTFPISPHLRTLLDEILRERRWDLKYLGMQIMVEGLALAAFGFISQTSSEPLIQKIVQMIMQDEARHVAFGVLSLRGVYNDMSASELSDREEFIVEASRLMRDRFMMQEVWEQLGLPVDECLKISMESEPVQMFRAMLFSKIVPNVKRLGLLTPRVRRGFEELGVIQFETWDASA